MSSAHFLHLTTLGTFAYFTIWIIIRPFIDENLLLEILFPEIRFLVPFLLLSAFWIFVAVAVTKNEDPEVVDSRVFSRFLFRRLFNLGVFARERRNRKRVA